MKRNYYIIDLKDRRRECRNDRFILIEITRIINHVGNYTRWNFNSDPCHVRCD